MIYTLLMVVSLFGHLQATTHQVFESHEECVEAGVALVKAYHEEYHLPDIMAVCVPGHEV